MTVAELIKELSKLPQGHTVYRDGGDYADDWRRVHKVETLDSWGTIGVLIE